MGTSFTVYTDHKPLRSLFTSEMKNTRIQRWAIILSEYGSNIDYKTGKTNVSADMLSRIAGTTQEDEILVLDTSNPSFSADPMETTKEPSTSAERFDEQLQERELPSNLGTDESQLGPSNQTDDSQSFLSVSTDL